eukprot:scaffold19973_cov67-Skeletonema_dohrnii-CCMP3373.AAC.1
MAKTPRAGSFGLHGLYKSQKNKAQHCHHEATDTPSRHTSSSSRLLINNNLTAAINDAAAAAADDESPEEPDDVLGDAGDVNKS